MVDADKIFRNFLPAIALVAVASLAHAQELEIPKNPSIELPPHFEEVAYGLYACERGWVLYQGRCVTDTEVPHGPVVEISSLRSAGDGAPGTCPSGGCGARDVRTRPRAPARHGFGRRHGCVGGLLSRICW